MENLRFDQSQDRIATTKFKRRSCLMCIVGLWTKVSFSPNKFSAFVWNTVVDDTEQATRLRMARCVFLIKFPSGFDGEWRCHWNRMPNDFTKLCLEIIEIFISVWVDAVSEPHREIQKPTIPYKIKLVDFYHLTIIHTFSAFHFWI